MNPEPPSWYQTLGIGEVLQTGDQVWICGSWWPTYSEGLVIGQPGTWSENGNLFHYCRPVEGPMEPMEPMEPMNPILAFAAEP